MSLLAEIKQGGGKPAGKPDAMRILDEKTHDPAAGKALIRETLHQIADAWSEIEHSGGSIAWEWILRGSPHGPRIRAAEDKVNRIGSKGDPTELKSACTAWISSWREGIEAWKYCSLQNAKTVRILNDEDISNEKH